MKNEKIAQRRKVAREGWGARLLAKQDSDGKWAGGLLSDGGLYSPKWISTTYTMLLMRDFGLPVNNRQTRKACTLLLNGGLQPDGGINYGTWAKWIRRGETCVTGMVLSILSHFEYDDDRLDTIAQHLLEQQMPDGGWNCQRPNGATHASMHTTIGVLEGLRFYEVYRGRQVRATRAAQRCGREFLLVHRLFRSHRTGEIIKPIFTRFAFPPRLPCQCSKQARGGTTTFSVLSTISKLSTHLVITASPRQSTSSAAASARTTAGRCNTRTRVKHISSLNASAHRAAGTPSARCGC